MVVSQKEPLGVTDFRLAGFLLARGASFLSTSISPKNEVVFLFDNSPDAEGLTALGIMHMYPGSPEQKYDAACRTMHDFTKVLLRQK